MKLWSFEQTAATRISASRVIVIERPGISVPKTDVKW
jgi:hypothetical protein